MENKIKYKLTKEEIETINKTRDIIIALKDNIGQEQFKDYEIIFDEETEKSICGLKDSLDELDNTLGINL